MKSADQIPFYGPDGTSFGFRTIEAARLLIANGFVKPAYGRKGHLRAIFLQQESGGNPVEIQPRTGTKYSFLQNLENGTRCWALRRLDGRRDDDGIVVSTRAAFLQVVADCTVL